MKRGCAVSRACLLPALIDYIWKIKMSVINNSAPEEEEFELLQPDPLPSPPSEEVFLSLNGWITVPPEEKQQLEDMTVGIVVDEETFIVLDRKDSAREFSLEEWHELVQRKQREVAGAEGAEKGVEGRARLSLKERSAVLSLKSSDQKGRQLLWQIANYAEGIEQQFAAKQKCDQQSKQQILTILSYELAEEELRSLKQNVLKLHKVVRAIGERRGSNADALRVWEHEKEIMQWVYDSLIRYAIEDQQVRYCKGLEYVCLGIVVAFPRVDLPKYSQLLHHFLLRNAFRDLYQEGSPRFFRELTRIRQALREDAPELYGRIEEGEGDFRNLFVSYFRSCLIYKVTDPEVIRKVFELLFVEGIQAMKAILLRILTVHAAPLMQQQNFLEHLCSQIVRSYFQGSNTETAIHQKFEQLFLI